MIEETLDIATKDGAMETFVCQPERGGPCPPVLLLMDAPGIREELRDMARRLGTVGYFVLLPNLYYRAGRDTVFGPNVLEEGSAERARMRAVRTKMTIPPVMEDVAAMLAFVDGHKEAKPGPVGVHGYCMSGPYALAAAARYPDRIAAAALVLRHLAGQRRRGEPASLPRQGQGRALHRLRRARRISRRCRWSRNCAACFSAPALPERSSCIPASITASHSRNAGATTSPPPSATGSASWRCTAAAWADPTSRRLARRRVASYIDGSIRPARWS